MVITRLPSSTESRISDSALRRLRIPIWARLSTCSIGEMWRKGVDVGEAQIVDERRVVDMGVEVDDVQRLPVLVPPDDRVGHRVVAAEHHRQRAGGEDRLGHVGRVVERAVDVGGPYVDVADVGDGPVRHLVGEVGAPGLRVVEPGLGGREPQRMLANRARTHPRAGEEGRAFVEGDAEDRDVGVERVEVGFDRRAQKGRDADERAMEVQPGTSAARCHGRPSIPITRFTNLSYRDMFFISMQYP